MVLCSNDRVGGGSVGGRPLLDSVLGRTWGLEEGPLPAVMRR